MGQQMDDRLVAWFRRKTEDIADSRALRELQAWSGLRDGVGEGDRRGVLVGSSGSDQLSIGKPPTYPKLKGEAGIPSIVAGALNSITSGPNTSASIATKMAIIRLHRGGGQTVEATGVEPWAFTASGTLAPATSRREVSFSQIKAGAPKPLGFASVPNQVRVYNPPDGRLLYEIKPGLKLKVGPLTVINQPAGRYQITR